MDGANYPRLLLGHGGRRGPAARPAPPRRHPQRPVAGESEARHLGIDVDAPGEFALITWVAAGSAPPVALVGPSPSSAWWCRISCACWWGRTTVSSCRPPPWPGAILLVAADTWRASYWLRRNCRWGSSPLSSGYRSLSPCCASGTTTACSRECPGSSGDASAARPVAATAADISLALGPARFSVCRPQRRRQVLLLRLIAGDIAVHSGQLLLGGRPGALAAPATWPGAWPTCHSSPAQLSLYRGEGWPWGESRTTPARRSTATSFPGHGGYRRQPPAGPALYPPVRAANDSGCNWRGIQPDLGRRPGGLLLLDEPTTALDLAHQQLVATRCAHLAAGARGGIVLIHDFNLVAGLADRIAVLPGRRLAACGHRRGVSPSNCSATCLTSRYWYSATRCATSRWSSDGDALRNRLTVAGAPVRDRPGIAGRGTGAGGRASLTSAGRTGPWRPGQAYRRWRPTASKTCSAPVPAANWWGVVNGSDYPPGPAPLPRWGVSMPTAWRRLPACIPT